MCSSCVALWLLGASDFCTACVLNPSAPPLPPQIPQADKFHKTGRQLRSRMWWQNMKMKLIVVFILILIAVIIFCAVCFSGGKRCF